MRSDDENKIAELMELDFYKQEIGSWGGKPRRPASVVMPNGCIYYDGSPNSKGYGVRRGKLTHREAVEEVRGIVIPDDWDVHHRCGNKKCYRDDHLQPMPHKEHAEENATNRKLDADKVREILVLLDAGEKQAAVAARFGVTRSCITHIKAGARWKRVVLDYRAATNQICGVTPLVARTVRQSAA